MSSLKNLFSAVWPVNQIKYWSKQHISNTWGKCGLMDGILLLFYQELGLEWVWWHIALIPALRSQRQTDLCEFEASLVYIVSSTIDRAR